MKSPTTSRLFLEDKLLGVVTANPASVDRRWEGLIHPATDYQAARASLQALTIGLASVSGSEPSQIKELIVTASQSLKERGLQLRDDSGSVIPTDSIIVSDCYPLTCEFHLLGTLLPIPILYVLTEQSGL